MKDILLSVIELAKSIKDYRIILKIFIMIIMVLIIFYPIIDANFFYYKRVSNRIEIIDKLSDVDVKRFEENKILKKEYNLILEEIENNENNYLSNLIKTKDSKTNNIIKVVSSIWLFCLAGIVVLFSKNKTTGKWSINNLFSTILAFLIASILGYIGYKIPTIINVIVNVVIYQIGVIYIAYLFTKINSTT